MQSAKRAEIESKSGRSERVLRSKFRPSRKMVITAIAVAGMFVGIFSGWHWVAGAGLSSIVLGLLPCVAMCAAGLCMNRMGRNTVRGESGESYSP